jgi:hypothetical protein
MQSLLLIYRLTINLQNMSYKLTKLRKHELKNNKNNNGSFELKYFEVQIIYNK